MALDLNHVQDRGTTWQTCHDCGTDSEQFRWYERLTADRPPGFAVTLHNERNATMRGQEQGAWHGLFRRGELVVSGLGPYAERAEADGLTYLNTSLGKGTKYRDPRAEFIAAEAGYALLTFEEGKAAAVELKALDGKVLDRTAIPVRAVQK